MPISTYEQYRNLHRVDWLEAGDLLLKKVFPETCKGAVKWGITTGEKLFSGDTHTAGIFSAHDFASLLMEVIPRSTQPSRSQPMSLKCNVPTEFRLKTDSSLYRDLVAALRPTGLLIFT